VLDFLLHFVAFETKKGKTTEKIAHLAIPDHSKQFWLTVQSLCPETERAKQWLCVNGHKLLLDLHDLLASPLG
jgi:hypothetical protein